METLRDKGRPNFKIPIQRSPGLNPMIIRYFHQDEGDRELPLIMGLMRLFPNMPGRARPSTKHRLFPMTGSGPYVISEVKAGESVTYKKKSRLLGKNSGD